MTHLYVLDDSGQPRRERDVRVWARWFETADRRVARTLTANVEISTVFLGIDHNFDFGPNADRTPVLWETMVFGPNVLIRTECRYSSLDDARTGHEVIVADVEYQLRERYESRQKP